MIKINGLCLNSIPRVVVVLSDVDSVVAKRVKREGADALELRIDYFKHTTTEYVVKVVKRIKSIGLPVIGTIRDKKEGGKQKLSDKRRLKLFDAILPLVDAIDVELSSKLILNKIIKKAKTNKKIVIVSYHNLNITPTSSILRNIIRKAEKAGGDLIKIATMVKTQKNIEELASLVLNHKNKNLVVIALGSKGTVSRAFFPSIGSLMTYACVDIPSAPGQLSFSELREDLRRFYPKYNEALIRRLD